MPQGRSADVARRNAEIKAMRAGEMSYGRPLSVQFVADYHGLSRQKVWEITADPSSHVPTRDQYRARPVVSLLEDHGDDGISHGSVSGYRHCLRRPQGACQDCKDANAEAQAQYQERRRAREAAAQRRRR